MLWKKCGYCVPLLIVVFCTAACVERYDLNDGDGVEIWTDPNSGLEWQVTPTGGGMDWADARAHCSNLGGGWRLPDIGELRSLIRGCPATELGSATCHVEPAGCLDSTCNDGGLCKDCSIMGGPGEGGCYWPDEVTGACSAYWSSSPVGANENYAWYVNFDGGIVYSNIDYNYLPVRCVR